MRNQGRDRVTVNKARSRSVPELLPSLYIYIYGILRALNTETSTAANLKKDNEGNVFVQEREITYIQRLYIKKTPFRSVSGLGPLFASLCVCSFACAVPVSASLILLGSLCSHSLTILTLQTLPRKKKKPSSAPDPRR